MNFHTSIVEPDQMMRSAASGLGLYRMHMFFLIHLFLFFLEWVGRGGARYALKGFSLSAWGHMNSVETTED